MCTTTSKLKFLEFILGCVRLSLNSFQLHFLSNESLKLEKTVVASENFDGKLFKNASS